MSENLRIGLYICHCGHNIAGVISPEAWRTAARDLPGVVVCRDHLYSCSEAGQRDIAKDIRECGLNRMVVAACSPKLHEPTFRRLLADCGVNPYLLEIVNIREQCSWVHAREPEAALVKALELIRMGLAKVRDAVPLTERQVPMTRAGVSDRRGPGGPEGRPGHRPYRNSRNFGGARPGAGRHGQPAFQDLSPGRQRPKPHQPHDGRGDAPSGHQGAD